MSDHHAPIPPPVQKPHPAARMMQAMTGEWLWAISVDDLPPTGEPTLRAKVEALRDTDPPIGMTAPYSHGFIQGWNAAVGAVLALLPATGEPRPAKDAAVYDRLYEAWNTLSFDVTTMPPAAKDTAITACREELDAVLKGFEGRSFTSWCDAQWADGSGRVSLPPNRPATGEPAPTCATCRHLLSKKLAVCTRLEAPAISFGPLQDRKSTPPESFCCNWHEPKPTGGAQ